MLRKYQSDCVDSCFAEWEKDVQSIIAVLATGLGKTVIAAEVIRRIQPTRTLFFAHRDTLIFQARDTIQKFAGVQCGIEMAELKVEKGFYSKDAVVIGTIQTQNAGNGGGGRMKDFRPTDFGLIICDEAHHFVAPSFKRVLDYFMEGNPNIKVLGITATPDRTDQEALGQVFKKTVYQYGILDGIHDGWLVPIDQQMIPVSGLDYSHISTTAGDLNLGELSAVMEEEEMVQRMIQPTLEVVSSLPPHRLDYASVGDWGAVIEKHGKPRRALVFCTSVIQAQRFAEIMNRVRPGMAAAVWDKVPKPERRKLFSDFSSGVLQVLVNVGICTEGFDIPQVEVVVMARATKSRSLYTQIIGRGTRPLPGLIESLLDDVARRAAIAGSAKPGLLVCDFVGNSGRHKLITVADILGGRVSEKAIVLAKKKSLATENPVHVSELLEDSEDIIRKRIERAKREAESRRVKLVARAKFTTITVNPFDAYDLQPAREVPGMNKRLSEKQLAFLRRAGIDATQYPYPQAKQLFLETLKRFKNKLAGPGQCQILKQHGYDPKNMTRSDADKVIDQLRNNGWQRPAIPKLEPPI